ncbi:hypothetical protein F511_19116 [Dorcoceras hygrometricum]|uniref:Dystroglycan-like n=1 Tax=Dorcoceras hygrometricum TaxID=472368 RepID=A0A2Z7BY07_9LAMI|nr:hypothetical protein F511_19116 [Dorcoceras hygrometricum]
MTMSLDTMSFRNQARNWKSVDRLLYLLLVVASAEEQKNDIRTATEDDQQQLRNLVIVIYFRSGGTVASSRGDNLRWKVPVDWYTSRKIPVAEHQSQGTLTLYHLSKMASSLISRSHHIDFDSVFRFVDAVIVQMFESLVTTGLMEFLGCPAIFHENALTEFFANGSVRDGMVVSTIGGIAVEISESVFAATFGLPTEGLTDLSEVPRNLLSDAQSLFSVSETEVNISCLKKEIKMQYRLLSDILAKYLFVKAGSFDAVTRDRFLLMTAITFDVKVNWGNLLFGVLKEMVTPDSRQAKGYAIQICVLLKNIPGLELGESKSFPDPRILNEKTVHRIVSVNENVGIEYCGRYRQSGPRPETRLLRQPALEGLTRSARTDSPRQIGRKRFSGEDGRRRRRRRRTAGGGGGGYRGEEGRRPMRLGRYLARDQPWNDMAVQVFSLLSAAHSQSLDDFKAQQQEHNLELVQPISSPPVIDSTDRSGVRIAHFYSIAKSICWVRPVVLINGVWTSLQESGYWRSDCALSLFVDRKRLPASVTAEYFDSEVPLIEPARYWGAAPLLVKIWAWQRVCTEVFQFSVSGRLRPAGFSSDIVIRNLGVERLPDYFLDDFELGVNIDYFADFLSGSSGQSGSEFDSASSSGNTVYRSPSPPDYAYDLGPPILSPTVQEEKLYFVQSPVSSPAASPPQESSSSSSDASMHFDSEDLPVHDQEAAHTSAPVDSNVFTTALEDLRSYISQRIHESTYEIRSKVNDVEFNVRGDLLKQQAWLRQTFQNACDVLERQSKQMNDLKKGLMAPVGTILQDLFDIKKNQRAQEAKLNALDGQVAALRNEQLEFQNRISADLLSLSTQFSDIVEYIRGGDAKKGEGGSISRPQAEAQEAKLNALDGQVAALRNEQLEFQNRISADLLSLSTQFSDIVEYIRGGDAKKGEGGSISRPPPVRVERRPLPTPQSPHDVAGSSRAVRIPTFPRTTGTFTERVEQARRHILERTCYHCRRGRRRIRQADFQESDRLQRERERARREKRSSSSRRRRGF